MKSIEYENKQKKIDLSIHSPLLDVKSFCFEFRNCNSKTTIGIFCQTSFVRKWTTSFIDQIVSFDKSTLIFICNQKEMSFEDFEECECKIYIKNSV